MSGVSEKLVDLLIARKFHINHILNKNSQRSFERSHVKTGSENLKLISGVAENVWGLSIVFSRLAQSVQVLDQG